MCKHPFHRSFNVERPASASTNAMIQKRITTVGSLQPELFEMVVDRRHLEHAFAGALVEEHLDDDAHRLDHEQPADDAEHDFMMRDDRNRPQRPAERKAPRIAHEHGGRRAR